MSIETTTLHFGAHNILIARNVHYKTGKNHKKVNKLVRLLDFQHSHTKKSVTYNAPCRAEGIALPKAVNINLQGLSYWIYFPLGNFYTKPQSNVEALHRS